GVIQDETGWNPAKQNGRSQPSLPSTDILGPDNVNPESIEQYRQDLRQLSWVEGRWRSQRGCNMRPELRVMEDQVNSHGVWKALTVGNKIDPGNNLVRTYKHGSVFP
ncbi:hypothetical protein XENOCAPTIV_024445, partial [Xenoophorus captivus]